MPLRFKALSSASAKSSVVSTVFGDWAWVRNHIDITVTPPGGDPTHRAGYTLSILQKVADGRWRLARDANLVT